MSKANNLTDFLTDIANTIRSKKGYSSNTKINPQSFSNEISNLNIPHNVVSSWYPSNPEELVLSLYDSRTESSEWGADVDIIYDRGNNKFSGVLRNGSSTTMATSSFLNFVEIIGVAGTANGSDLELEIDDGYCVLTGSELPPYPTIRIVTVSDCRYLFVS